MTKSTGRHTAPHTSSTIHAQAFPPHSERLPDATRPHLIPTLADFSFRHRASLHTPCRRINPGRYFPPLVDYAPLRRASRCRPTQPTFLPPPAPRSSALPMPTIRRFTNQPALTRVDVPSPPSPRRTDCPTRGPATHPIPCRLPNPARRRTVRAKPSDTPAPAWTSHPGPAPTDYPVRLATSPHITTRSNRHAISIRLDPSPPATTALPVSPRRPPSHDDLPTLRRPGLADYPFQLSPLRRSPHDRPGHRKELTT
jgi:hypothetical protein